MTPSRLAEIGATIAGRVQWSACTKLNRKLTATPFLQSLHDKGLATLEVGLESLLVETQKRVAKVHPPHLFEDFLANFARINDKKRRNNPLSLIVNYMTGFPWEDPQVSLDKRDEAAKLIQHYLGGEEEKEELGELVHNEFELERLSPMAQDPERYHFDKTSLKVWPWASVMEHKPLAH